MSWKTLVQDANFSIAESGEFVQSFKRKRCPGGKDIVKKFSPTGLSSDPIYNAELFLQFHLFKFRHTDVMLQFS